MGYSTYFFGNFKLDKPLKPEHAAYLLKFSATRRMKRHAQETATRPDPVRIAAGLPIGDDGEFFVGAGEMAGQEHSSDVKNYNEPPATQPGLWCQWVPSEDGTAIQWDEGEKFYDYMEWLEYLISKFLQPWGYILNGSVEWKGDESDDLGMILVVNNKVTVKQGKVVYE